MLREIKREINALFDVFLGEYVVPLHYKKTENAVCRPHLLERKFGTPFRSDFKRIAVINGSSARILREWNAAAAGTGSGQKVPVPSALPMRVRNERADEPQTSARVFEGQGIERYNARRGKARRRSAERPSAWDFWL